MIFKKPIVIFFFLLCINVPAIFAESQIEIEIDYNQQTNELNLNISDAYLDEVLTQLAEKLGFSLLLDGNDLHRLINFEMKGRTLSVLNKLVQPNSVIISQSDVPPNRVTNMILLPIGEQSREAKIREEMRPPPLSGDPVDNAERMKLHERRIQRRIQGLGRYNDEKKQ
ncbi:MAG: hypothetical protein QM500_03420 [Methylococcales bacterium]